MELYGIFVHLSWISDVSCHVRDRFSMIFTFSRIPQIQNAHDVPWPFVCL